MHRNTYIKHPQGHYADRSKGRGRGPQNGGGSRAPFSTHIDLNCNVGTRLGLRESKSIEIHISSIPRVTMPIGVRGRGRGAENAGGSRALFLHLYCFDF